MEDITLRRFFWCKNGLCFTISIGIFPYISMELWQAQIGTLICALLFVIRRNVNFLHMAFLFLGCIAILRTQFPNKLKPSGVFVGNVIQTSGYFVLLESKKGRIGCFIWNENPIEKNTILVTKYHEISPNNHLPNMPRLLKQVQRSAAQLTKCSQVTVLSQTLKPTMPLAFSNYSYGGVMWGLASGQRHSIDETTTKILRETGISHVLAISGMHVGLVAGMGALIGRLLTLCLMRFQSQFLSLLIFMTPICTILSGFLYGCRVGWPPSAQRAMWMLSVYVVARFFHRKILIYDILGIAAIAILYTQPYQFHALGFQLSFTAVLGIALITPRFTRLIPPDVHSVWRWLITSLGVSCGALLGTLPLCALYFQQIPWVSPITNILAVPIIAVIGVPCSLLASIVPTEFSEIFLYIGNAAIDIGLSIAKVFHFEVLKVGVGVLGCLVLFGLIGTLYRYEVILIVWICLIILWKNGVQPGTVKVTFLSIGQGDSAIIQWFDGRTWLIDGGVGTRDILFYLRSQGINFLDTVFLSHPHQDHMQGLFLVSEEIYIRRVIVPRAPEKDEENYLRLWDIWKRRQVNIIEVDQSDAEIDPSVVLFHPNHWKVFSKDKVNEESLVFYVEHGHHRFLFTGDIEEDAQKKILRDRKSNEIKRISVTKIPHHGSRSSASQDWVKYFPSTWGVISCGYKNRFGHPHKETLQVWKDSEILRTDLQGSIEFRSNGETISVRGFHQDRGWYWIKK